MSTIVETKASFLSRTSKALSGGIAGGVTAGATALTAAAQNGIDGSDLWPVVGAIAGGFVVGFAAVYAAPANAVESALDGDHEAIGDAR